MMNSIKSSKRLQSLPPYIFAQIEHMKDECLAKGMNIIDLGLGDPDFPTPPHIIEEARKQLLEPANHHYPSFQGNMQLRQNISKWYHTNYGIKLNPETEVLILIGSKEGLSHTPLAFVNQGDHVLIPDPAYPAYLTASLIAGGIPYFVPLEPGNGFKPDFSAIPPKIARNASLMFLNYPNNPTAALADETLFTNAISFAKENEVIICHDFAYSEITFNGMRPLSFMAMAEAMEIGVEFHSFSKTFAMTGWRLGFVVGNRDIIMGLSQMKSCVDSGVFKVVQLAGLEALNGPLDHCTKMIAEYQGRRDLLCNGLSKLGWQFKVPMATYYLWCKIPERFKMKSLAFSEHLISRQGIIVTPGIGFGQNGDNYVRLSINIDKKKISEALKRITEL